MSYTISLNGTNLRIVHATTAIPNFEYPLAQTVITFDKQADEVTFYAHPTKYLRIPVAQIATFNSIALLQAQLLVWQPQSQTVFGRLRGPIADTFTRPNDTTPYAAGDAIQNATSAPAVRRFQNLFPAGGGSGYLSIAAVVRNVNNTPRLRLHLFATDPTVKAVDNAAFSVNSADEGAYLGYIDLDALARGVACSSNRKEVVVAGTDLFYQIETLDAFTPNANTNYLFKGTLDSNV